MGIFDYMGFMALRLAPNRFMIIGQDFQGYAASENEAWRIIRDVTSRPCWE